MLLRDNWEKLGVNLKEEILAFSGALTFPIKAEMWEELISRHTMDPMGITNIWEAGSHKQGSDIDLPNEDYSFSVKSAKVGGVYKQKMSISSFRTTKHETLKEKLDFIDGSGKNFSHYFVLAREEDKKKSLRNYEALIIPGDLFAANDLTWESTKSGWASKEKFGGELGYEMKIQKKMSDQLWIYCDYKKLKDDPRVKVLFSVSIPYDELGKTHKLIRRAA